LPKIFNASFCNTRRLKERGARLLEVVERKRLRRGILIAIEGIDRAGKTTQSIILLDKLSKSGYPVVRFHEPTDGIWGKRIKDLAQNGRHEINAETELAFFYSDRLEDVKDNIEPSLKDKKIVIMDRYYFSSVAYQGARGLAPDYVEKKNEDIAPKPDILIVLDLVPEVALNRIRHKRNAMPNHFERKKYLDRVRQIFLKQFSGRPNVRIIDGDDTRSISVVAREIWEIVEPIMRDVEKT